MTTDPALLPTTTPSWKKPWQLGLVAFLLFGLLGTGVAYYGVQDQVRAMPTQTAKKEVLAAQSTITRIEMPFDDPPVPPGPHREEFRVACTVCHSPRLVFTQPILAQKQWNAVVHKMVTVYGAPLSAEEETRVVTYLQAVQGK